MAATVAAPWVPAAEADTLPSASVGNVSVLEGDVGRRQLRFPVTLSAPAPGPVSLTYSTVEVFGGSSTFEDYDAANGVAAPSAVGDYVERTRSVSFKVGQFQKVVTIDVLGDTVPEGDELFSLDIVSASGATILHGSGTGTILEDDAGAPGFRLGIGDASVVEHATKSTGVQLVVVFSEPAPAPFTLDVTTVPATATPRQDFAPKTQRMSIPAGQTARVIGLTVKPDALVEGSESFFVDIASSLGTVHRGRGTVVIRDAQASHDRIGRRPGPPRVTLVGDSVGANYQERAKTRFEDAGWQVSQRGRPGWGLLDADTCAGQLASTVLSEDDPDVVVMESIANYAWFPACEPVVAYGTPAWLDRWRAVVTLYTEMFTATGAQVYWVVNPSVPEASNAERHDAVVAVNSIYGDVAAALPLTHLIDAWTPFGGDPPECSLRTNGISSLSYCVHLSPAGQDLMASLVFDAVTGTG